MSKLNEIINFYQADLEKVTQSKALSEWLPVITQGGRSTVLGIPKGDVTLVAQELLDRILPPSSMRRR